MQGGQAGILSGPPCGWAEWVFTWKFAILLPPNPVSDLLLISLRRRNFQSSVSDESNSCCAHSRSVFEPFRFPAEQVGRRVVWSRHLAYENLHAKQEVATTAVATTQTIIVIAKAETLGTEKSAASMKPIDAINFHMAVIEIALASLCIVKRASHEITPYR